MDVTAIPARAFNVNRSPSGVRLAAVDLHPRIVPPAQPDSEPAGLRDFDADHILARSSDPVGDPWISL